MAQYWYDPSEDGLAPLTIYSPSDLNGSEPFIDSEGRLAFPSVNSSGIAPAWFASLPWEDATEIYVLYDDPQSAPGAGGYVAGFLTGQETDKGYLSRIQEDDKEAIRRINAVGDLDGISANRFGLFPEATAQLALRSQRVGNQIEQSFWSASESEPSTPKLATTDSTYATTHACVATGRVVDVRIIGIGVGTDGDPAPADGGAVSAPQNLSGEQDGTSIIWTATTP